MVEFNLYIAEKWNISKDLASKICEHFEKGDSIYYLNDYNAEIATELNIAIISDIYYDLKEIQSLSPKKKRILTALKKIDVLDKEIEKRIKLITNSFELDDILLTYKPNPRSRGQKALKKGLGPLADIIDDQEIETGSIDDLAKEYINKDPSLKTTADVLNGVKDIMAERYAYDETVRSMVREVGFENGFFEVVAKNKKDKGFVAYRGKMLSVNELASEEYISLCLAEEKKEIRLKHGIQLFHINELLRHHFIENPDFIGFDFICDVINECWTRLLQPIVESVVKERLYKKAEEWALRKIEEDFHKRIEEDNSLTTILITAKYDEKNLIITALNSKGHLLGATNEKISNLKNKLFSNRIKQFYLRHKPSKVIIINNKFIDNVQAIIKQTLHNFSSEFSIEKYDQSKVHKDFIKSKWMQEKYSVLEDDMKKTYAIGLTYLKPLSIISQIGIQYFSIHPLQTFIKSDRLEQLLIQEITQKEIRKGIPYLETPESVLQNLDCIPNELLLNIRKEGIKKPFTTKNSLLNIDGMTEVIFRNIAGYIIISKAKGILDRTLIHPDYYDLLNDISSEINASLESLVSNPNLLQEYSCEDSIKKIFILKKISKHLSSGQKYQLPITNKKHQRKQRLPELKIGTVVTGRVTNITKFGVFVDINAVCDGLIHISQLANGFIETADQVVSLDELVDVKILKVDKKKRRVSLSMKKSGSKPPKIRPSQGQLSSLADHFKNR